MNARLCRFYLRLLILPFLPLPLMAQADPAEAFEVVETTTQTFTEEFILSNIPDFAPTPVGGTDWKLFGATRQIAYSEKDAQGFERSGVRPEFSEDMRKLDGKTVKIIGYMFPMDEGETQKVFLFGPFPLSCPYHYHVSNNLVIEAHAAKPIAFSYDPLTLEGRLELVARDDDYNTFYRLHDVRIAR